MNRALIPLLVFAFHGDFERGCIATQVLITTISLRPAQNKRPNNKAKMHTEGKTYVMAPDDVVEFRFNV